MVAILVMLALILLCWWIVWTVRVFASIARDLCRAAVGVGNIIGILWRHFQRPPDLLADFMARRRSARH